MGAFGDAPGSERGQGVRFVTDRTTGTTTVVRVGLPVSSGGSSGIPLLVSGLDDLLGKLRRLTDVSYVANKLGTALAIASDGVVRGAKANLSSLLKGEGTGNLLDSIGYVIRDSHMRSGRVDAVIGPAWPKGAHGHLFERGTVERYRKTRAGGTAYTGKMPAQPFLEPAFRAELPRAKAVLERELMIAIKDAASG